MNVRPHADVPVSGLNMRNALVVVVLLLLASCLAPAERPEPHLASTRQAASAPDAGLARCWVDRDGDFIAERLADEPCRSADGGVTADGGSAEVGCYFFIQGACPSARQAAPTARLVFDPREVLDGGASPGTLGTVTGYWTKPPPDDSVTFLDCDDFDATASPRLPEAPLDGVDNDCDGLVDEHTFLASEAVPAPGTVANRANVHPIAMQINDDATHQYLSEPAHTSVLVDLEVRRAAQPATATVLYSVTVANAYDPLTHVLTVTMPPNVVLPNKVYVLQLMLRDALAAGSPALGPIQTASDPLNETYVTVSGSGPLATAGLSPWARAYVLKGLAELVRYQRGETGWAGTLYPNGEKWGAAPNTFMYCNFGPEWMGKQTSKAFSPDGGASPLWREAPGAINEKYRDVARDGECKATGANCPLGGVCAVVDPSYPQVPEYGAPIPCSTATASFQWGVRDDDDGIFYADDGQAGTGSYYVNPLAMDFATWAAGDVEHLQWNATDWHWAVFLDYAPEEEWDCDGTLTTGVIAHLSFNGCGNGVCVTRLGAQCDGYRSPDAGAPRKYIVERMHHTSPFTD